MTNTNITVVSSSVNETGNGTGSITVLGLSMNGSSVPIYGAYIDLRINGTHVASGYTPVTFTNLQLGVQYGVVVYWFSNYYIRYINDSLTGIDLQRYDLVTLNASDPQDTLQCYFQYVPSAQAASLNILAEFPNGTLIGTASYYTQLNYILHSPGMWVTIIPQDQTEPFTGTYTGGSILPFILFNHESYTIDMSSAYCGEWYTGLSNGTIPTVDIVWSHWLNGSSTDSNLTVSLNSNVTYVAVYNQIYPASCSSANSTTASDSITVTTTTNDSAAKTAVKSAVASNGATENLFLGFVLASTLPGLFILPRVADYPRRLLIKDPLPTRRDLSNPWQKIPKKRHSGSS